MPNSLWEGTIFPKIWQRVYDEVENMNPDSLIQILRALSTKKGSNQKNALLAMKIVHWVIKVVSFLLLISKLGVDFAR